MLFITVRGFERRDNLEIFFPMVRVVLNLANSVMLALRFELLCSRFHASFMEWADEKTLKRRTDSIKR